MDILVPSERPFYDINDSDLLDVWESDMSVLMSDPFKIPIGNSVPSDLEHYWPVTSLPSETGNKESNSREVVKNDRLLTDSVCEGHEPGHVIDENQLQSTLPVKTEHSYSLGMIQDGTVGSDGESLPESPGSLSDDMDSDCYYASFLKSHSNNVTTTSVHHFMSASNASKEDSSASSSSGSVCGSISADSSAYLSSDDCSTIKDEPQSRPSTPQQYTAIVQRPQNQVLQPYVVKEEPSSGNETTNFLMNSNSLLRSKASTIRPSATAAIFLSPSCKKSRIGIADGKLINIKVGPDQGSTFTSTPYGDNDSQQLKRPTINTHHNSNNSFTVIRTSAGPNKTSGHQTITSRNVTTTKVVFGQSSLAPTRHPIQTSLISYQPKGAIGDLCLTEEEKRTLISEGYPIPQRLPLTKSEEKSLKKIRRKIKNKISAQESRRKKKEYMDTLEKRMDAFAHERDSILQEVSELRLQLKNLKTENDTLKAIISKCGISYAM